QYGNTPLHEAAVSGHSNMLKSLVEEFARLEKFSHRGQINKENNSGDTPLHLAVRFDHPDIVKFLVQKGADQTIRNKQG
ncbi:unnamed protein product, partial [Tuber aestivum]